MMLMGALYVDLIGVPFEYGGRGPKTYDCWGLIMELHRRIGVKIPDYRTPDAGDLAAIAKIMDAEKRLWRETQVKPGATLLLRVLNLPCHVGYVVDRFRMIHTWEKSGGVLTEPLSEWCPKRLVGAYEYVGHE